MSGWSGLWLRYRPAALRAAVLLLGAAAVLKLGSEFHRLTIAGGFEGAVDLRMRYYEVEWWFSGQPFYGEIRRLTYPPHLYALLWPFTGWLELGEARWLWAGTTVLVLGGLVAVLVRGSAASTPVERTLVALIVLSMNAVGVATGNGQLVLHLLLATVAGLLLLRARPAWRTDLLAALLLAVAMAKPTLTLPFIWLAFATAGRGRPIVLAIAVGAALTLFAAAFQPEDPIALLAGWLAEGRPQRISRGYGDVHSALGAIGLSHLALPASLVLFFALGLWIARHRQADFWTLLGVSALMSRFWIYHRVYDDALILLPMVALFRIAKTGKDGERFPAGVILAVAVLAMLAPAAMETAAPPLNHVFTATHVGVWLIMLWFLVRAAAGEPGRSSDIVAAST